MRVTQDLNSFGEIIAHAQCSVDEKRNIYIPCVPHKNNCTQKNWFTRHETERFLNNHCQEYVCALTLASMIIYLFFTRSWSAIIRPKLFFTRSWSAIIGTKQPQQWRGRQTWTRICRFLVVGNIFRLETCMNSLVKAPAYSKLNFQGEIFLAQNWCNITLKKNL